MISHGLGDPGGGGMIVKNMLPGGVMIVKTGGGMILKILPKSGGMFLKNHIRKRSSEPSLLTAVDGVRECLRGAIRQVDQG